MKRIVVPGEAEGTRLDSFLAAVEEVGSRSAAQRLLEDGSVTVDDEARPKSHRVSAGEVVAVSPPSAAAGGDAGEPAVAFEIAYEDDALVVVDKPAGLVVHPAAGHQTGTLAQALGGRAGGGPGWRPGIVHRLDKDTSGLMVVAKSEPVMRELQELIKRRELTREYLALVSGRLDAAAGTIDAPIGRDPTRGRARPSRAEERATRGPISSSSSSCRARRSCGFASKRGEPTRSASTSPRSTTRSAVTPATAADHAAADSG